MPPLVIFGMRVAPAPPTDPTVGYPPGYDFRAGSLDRPAEGFAYPFLTGSVQGDRVRLTVNQLGLWEPWCEMQTPVPLGGGVTGWGCLPEGGGSESSEGCTYEPADAPWFILDCGRMHLCQPPGMCTCTADSCTANLTRSTIAFDFHVTGANGTGSVDIGGLHNVYLTH